MAAKDDVALMSLAKAVANLRDVLEVIAGKVDLEGEAVYVRANLDEAWTLLAEVNSGRSDAPT